MARWVAAIGVGSGATLFWKVTLGSAFAVIEPAVNRHAVTAETKNEGIGKFFTEVYSEM
jgi:hypothetical protein